MALASLNARGAPLAAGAEQRALLATRPRHGSFAQRLGRAGLAPLQAAGLAVLQINVGKFCNQSCRHCHVDAGPDRPEQMSRATAALCIEALARSAIPTVDITGGAPELNPSFRWLVEQARGLGRHVIDRCNLSVLLLKPQADLAEFLARQRVEIIASLPYVRQAQTDAQRGDGVYARSLDALRLLNRLGYGAAGSGLVLNLVHNPAGAFLPPRQAALEAQFRRALDPLGIVFNRLYTITNMPISRYLEFLVDSGNFDGYMERLAQAFNPAAVAGVMCRSTLSVGWDGALYDCDFNQMLDLPVAPGAPRHIRDFAAPALAQRPIVTANHCFGCTAGAGSSCGGETA